MSPDGVAAEQLVFKLINDQPVADPSADLLGMEETASGIARMLMSSRAASPLVLAIDAKWGSGKSTLLRQIKARLEDISQADRAAAGKSGRLRRGGPGRVATVWFNAWTAEGSDALEGLIKSILEELDDSVLRRWARKVARRRRLVGVAWIATAVVARFLGVARLVDEFWKQAAIDAKSRNELRADISGMLNDWMSRDGKRDPSRCMLIFIDDLDRCSDDVIVKICEAIKVYLDVPGLIFVLACDLSVLARGVSGPARGQADEGRSYLEKIVQVVYRIPPPNESELQALVRGYAELSGTQDIVDQTVEKILIERSGRNPRKIKRIINSFILEYQLDPAWRRPPLSSDQLVIAILLQHLYPSFYELLTSDAVIEDPIGQFLDYVQLRDALDAESASREDVEGLLQGLFAHYGLTPRSIKSAQEAEAEFERIQKKLPEEFTTFAANESLHSLLKGLDSEEAREALRTQLSNRPLATSAIQAAPELVPAVKNRLAGVRIVCVNDNPLSIDRLVVLLTDLEAEVTVYSDAPEAERAILRQRPDVVISDITRGTDPDGGFTYAERLRGAGYNGSIIFFTARITQERRQRAAELGAVDIVSTEGEVLRILSAMEFPARKSPRS